jgi:NAD(P)-dependent dehydrogenase (short-subunit alcohol dehydrogenase family)
VESKGGIVGFVRSLASEVGDKGVTVNALSLEVRGHPEMGLFELLANAQVIKPNGMPADLAGARARGATMSQPFVFISTFRLKQGTLERAPGHGESASERPGG